MGDAMISRGITSSSKIVEFTATVGNDWRKINPSITVGGQALSSGNPYYIQNVIVNGIRESDNPIVGIVLGDAIDTGLSELMSWNCVSKIVTRDNEIWLTCYINKPTVLMNIRILCIR